MPEQKGTKVTLTQDEAYEAASIGVGRRIERLRDELGEDGLQISGRDGERLVTLTWDEVYEAALAGAKRAIDINYDSLRDNHRSGWPVTFDAQINASLAEYAVAKWLHLDPRKRPVRTADDHRIHVRWSPDPKSGLPVWEEDTDEDLYVLVTGGEATLRLIGWITGSEAKMVKLPRGVSLKNLESLN